MRHSSSMQTVPEYNEGKESRFSKLGRTIFLWFMLIALLPLAVASTLLWFNTRTALVETTKQTLTRDIKLKRDTIEQFFTERVRDLRLQAELQTNIHFMVELERRFQATHLNASDFVTSAEWAELSRNGAGDLRNFIQTYGYRDAFLVDQQGYILFSVMAGEDLGTNLLSGPYSNSGLSTAWRNARHSVLPVCSDLGHYQPTWNEAAMFLAQRVVDDSGTQRGVLAIQIPIDQINKIVEREIGNYNQEAKSYVIGQDLFVRAPQSAEESGHENAGRSRAIKTPATQAWLVGKQAYTASDGDARTRADAALTEGKPNFYINHQQREVLGVFTEIGRLHDLGLDWVLVTEIKKDAALGELKHLYLGTVIVLASMILLVAWCSYMVTNRISSPIRRISRRAKLTAVGILPEADLRLMDNEIGELADSFQKVVASIKEVTEVCSAIAVGDFSKSVVIKSEYDALGLAVNQMANNLREVVAQANAVAKGDYSGEIEPRSEKDELGLALSNMTSVLSELQSQKERQDWLTSGEVQLRNAMQGDLEIHELGKGIIQFVCRYLNASIGAFYVLDDKSILRLVSSYAYRKRKGVSNEFALGHGLVGQAAMEGESILVTDVPGDYVNIFSGLGAAPPRAILAIPFLYEDKVVGVLELGSFEVFSEDQIFLLEKFQDFVGIAVNTAQARSRMSWLLDQTREQAEVLQQQQQDLKQANTELEEQTQALLASEARLQTQQEELRSTNEELEEQTRALRESQARLQAQQEELQQINEELEERSEALERQRDEVKLKNQELERARRELAEKARDLSQTSKYKSEFLANMSHELRTPLNSMLILSQLLEKNQKGNLSDKQVEYAKTIYQSGSDLLSLINEILDLSKIEAGKMEVVVGQVAIRPFVNELALKFQPIAEEKGLAFAVTVAEDVPEHFATDPHRCEQILRNLLSNALKFTGEGHVKLSVALKPASAATGERLTFAVEDTGLGIPSEKRRLIFEAFQQADGTTSRQFGGTGLGLSISRELARLLQGDIDLDSEEGRGSTFTLRLPLQYEAKAAEQPDEFISSKAHDRVTHAGEEEEVSEQTPSRTVQAQSLRAKAKALTATPLEPPTVRDNNKPPQADYPDDRDSLQRGDAVILIIEDDAKFQWTLQNLARERGFKCLLANNGEAGLHMADYYRPDAILLDIGLPRMDGMAVMSRLKDNPDTRHIPVHFISGTDRNFEAMKMGAAGFLQKPATMSDLDQAFNRISHILSHPVKNLLIVEDDAKLRSSLKALTGGKDVKVHGVGTARAALEALRTEHYDCMVLDVNLPDISGYELLAAIRNDGHIPHLPIIVYTGRDLSESEKVQLDKYAESVIIKTANSAERLLDETILFLHRMEAELGGEQKRLLHLVHDKESIFRDKKILIVDDDMRNVFALSSVLEEKGMTIFIAVNGKEGLEQLKQNPDIDLVLMDIMMPEMNGYEATRAIRQNPDFRNLPVIALTAKAMKGDRHKCIDAGANDYMSKPVDTVKLLSLMRVWLY